MSANENELAASEHVRVPRWGEDQIEGLIEEGELSENDIDEILNGQREAHDRERVEPTIDNLLDRVSNTEYQVYDKKMDVFNEDIRGYMPENAAERDIGKPLQLHYWNNTVESYAGSLDKKRHHYIGVVDGSEKELAFHYEWTTLQKAEE